MICHSKGLDLEITDFEYHHDPTPSGKFIPSQTSGMLLIIFYYARRSRASHELCRSESKKAKIEEVSNNVSSERAEE